MLSGILTRLCLCVPVLLLALLLPAPDAAASKLLVVFRYDDYSEPSPTEVELGLIRAFQERGLSCTFAVTPFADETRPLSPAKMDMLCRAAASGVVDVALHGLTHSRRPGARGEFDGLDARAQAERLLKGKQFLQGSLNASVTTFVPPWNSYDPSTLKALEAAGFSCISGGYGVPPRGPCALSFLPATCAATRLRSVVESARHAGLSSAIVVVVMHYGEFREAGLKSPVLDLPEFRRILDWTIAQKDLEVCGSIAHALSRVKDLGPERFRLNHASFHLSFLVPAFLRNSSWSTTYLATDAARAARNSCIALICASHLAIALVAFAATFPIGLRAFRRWSRAAVILPLAFTALTGLIFLYAATLKLAGAARTLSLLAAVAGICMASWAALACMRRSRAQE